MFIWLSRKDRRIANLKAMIHNREEKIEALLRKIEYQDKEIEVAAMINAEHQKLNGQLQARLTDLENNIELLIHNLSAQKKKQIGL